MPRFDEPGNVELVLAMISDSSLPISAHFIEAISIPYERLPAKAAIGDTI